MVVDATYASHTLPLLRSVCAELGLRLVEGDDSDDDATTVFWHSLSNAPYKARRAALREAGCSTDDPSTTPLSAVPMTMVRIRRNDSSVPDSPTKN